MFMQWILSLELYFNSPNIWKTALCTLRNVATQVPEAGTELRLYRSRGGHGVKPSE